LSQSENDKKPFIDFHRCKLLFLDKFELADASLPSSVAPGNIEAEIESAIMFRILFPE